jgi:hypothetical protein
MQQKQASQTRTNLRTDEVGIAATSKRGLAALCHDAFAALTVRLPLP